MAGLDLLAVLGRQFHATQRLVQIRATRNPNEVIAETTTIGGRIADSVARFGGSWAFIISFFVFMMVYVFLNVSLGPAAWDRYPFILLNLFLSMLAAIQAPVIVMSQNRQDAKDRLVRICRHPELIKKITVASWPEHQRRKCVANRLRIRVWILLSGRGRRAHSRRHCVDGVRFQIESHCSGAGFRRDCLEDAETFRRVFVHRGDNTLAT
jgi:hypothetical protein